MIFLWISIGLLWYYNTVQDKEIKALEEEVNNNRRLLDYQFEEIMKLKHDEK